MADTFTILVFAAVAVFLVVGTIAWLSSSGSLYDRIGESALAEDEPRAGRRDAALAEEVRQLVEARNERRMRRGEQPLDVEAEVQRTLAELEG